MRIRYRSRALTDIDDIYRYISMFSVSGAENVARAIYAGINLAAEQPNACLLTDESGVRVKLVRRYRYKIFFSITEEDCMEILHVRHTSRLPWSGGE